MRGRAWSTLLVMFVVVAVCAAAQEFSPPLGAARLKPPLLLGAAVYWGMRREPFWAGFAAVWCGALEDALGLRHLVGRREPVLPVGADGVVHEDAGAAHERERGAEVVEEPAVAVGDTVPVQSPVSASCKLSMRLVTGVVVPSA